MERQPIFTDYDAARKLLEGITHEGHWHSCERAIENFTMHHKRNAAVGFFSQDLKYLLNNKAKEIGIEEIKNEEL